MTSNPEPIVQQLQHDFQNLLAYVTGPDARRSTPAAATTPPLAGRNRAAAPRLNPAPGDLAGSATARAAHASGGPPARATHDAGWQARRCYRARPGFCPAGPPAAGTTPGSLAGSGGGESPGAICVHLSQTSQMIACPLPLGSAIAVCSPPPRRSSTEHERRREA
jgi:hypothetical protein